MGTRQILSSLLEGPLARLAAWVVDRRFEGFLSLHVPREAPRDLGPVETTFTTSDGSALPVHADYRYSVKKGWQYFDTLLLLSRLDARALVPDEDRAFLKEAIGHRALSRPLAEAEQRLGRLLPGLGPHLVPGSNPPVLRPSDEEVGSLVRSFQRSQEKGLARLCALASYQAPRGGSLLEIGYTSGGWALFAFERMGFEVLGLDNFYGGLISEGGLHQHLKERLRSRVVFERGDLTRETPFPAARFDLVHSTSVLEHVLDLGAAFREMFRILKPGGALIHTYHPFFCPSGGHALGILDSPWGHVRLTREDYLRYVTTLRPLEAVHARAWIEGALNRATVAEVQSAILQAGFRLRLWRQSPAQPRLLADLTREIAEECLRRHPGIALDELVTETVLFLAQK